MTGSLFEERSEFRAVSWDDFKAPEVGIHYASLGTSGPSLVFIHGLSDGHAAYLPMMLALSDTARTYALDLRGHGRSGRTPGQYNVGGYGRDLIAFLEGVVREPAVLVGCSLGGVVACWTAARVPDRVMGLVLEDPPLYVGQMPALRETLFFPWFMVMLKLLDRHHETREPFPEFLEKVRHPQVSPPLQEVLAWNLHRLDPETMEAAVQGTMFDEFDPDEILPRIECPVHVIAARESEVPPALRDGDLDRMREQIPSLEWEIWEDTLHAIHYQHPKRLGSVVRRLVEQTLERPAATLHAPSDGQRKGD